jgi:hypothetical protein
VDDRDDGTWFEVEEDIEDDEEEEDDDIQL